MPTAIPCFLRRQQLPDFLGASGMLRSNPFSQRDWDTQVPFGSWWPREATNLLQQTPNPTTNLRLSDGALSKARLLKCIGATLSSRPKPQSRHSVWDLILEQGSAQSAESIWHSIDLKSWSSSSRSKHGILAHVPVVGLCTCCRAACTSTVGASCVRMLGIKEVSNSFPAISIRNPLKPKESLLKRWRLSAAVAALSAFAHFSTPASSGSSPAGSLETALISGVAMGCHPVDRSERIA